MLQDQMAKMRPHDGYDSPSTIKMEKEVITQHRKRKKVEDEDDDDEEAALESSLANHSAFTNVVQEVMHAAVRPWCLIVFVVIQANTDLCVVTSVIRYPALV